MLESVEGNFDNPKVYELLTKHFVELKDASPQGSAHVLDIPGLKELFNQRRMSISKRNLVIFLKPTIVNEISVSEYTVEKFLKLKELSEIARENNSFKLKYPPLPFIENLQ